ncbi:MAG: sulfatase-like hydrolase/transferase [Planctomyces sp.]
MIATTGNSRIRGFAAALIVVIAAAGIAFWLFRRTPMNVLLITLDTTRADHLGCYGYQQALTPTIDALAAEGVLFENAFTTVALTLPAHTSILTGRYPPENGVHQNGAARLEESIPTLTSRLSESGYSTSAFIASVVLHSRHGLNQKFDVYDDDMAGGRRHGHETHLMRDGNQIVDSALEWLGKHRQSEKKPFFCWMHFYDPHAPFEGHAETFGDRFRDKPYDGDIAFTDLQLQRVIEDLKQNGQYDNTLIVVVGDHGEGFGEHLEDEHGFMLYNSTMRVPLIMAAPGVWKSGHRVSESVSVVDIPSSILETLEIPVNGAVGGTSLLQALQGNPIESRACYSEAEVGLSSYGWAPLAAVTRGPWKYISSARSELYDLQKDPGELNNLIETLPDQKSEMEQLLQDVRDQMTVFSGGRLDLTEADRRKLEAIGYLSGGTNSTPSTDIQTLPDIKDMIVHYNAEVRARKLNSEGQSEEAEALLREVIQKAPDFIPARLSLGAVLESRKQPDEARKVYEETVSLYPDAAQAWFDLGRLLTQTNDLPGAIKNYTRCVELDPHYATAWFNLGSLLYATGKISEAKEHFEKGLKEFPDSTVGLFNFGVLLMQEKEPEAALKFIRRAARLSPDNPRLSFQEGLVLEQLERWAEASFAFEKVLKLNPAYPNANQKLMDVRNRM